MSFFFHSETFTCLVFPLDPGPSDSNSLRWPQSVHFFPTATALVQPPSLLTYNLDTSCWSPCLQACNRLPPVQPATGCWGILWKQRSEHLTLCLKSFRRCCLSYLKTESKPSTLRLQSISTIPPCIIYASDTLSLFMYSSSKHLMRAYCVKHSAKLFRYSNK